MDGEMRQGIVIKLLTVWNANPDLSFYSLLSSICGEGTTHYILQTFDQGSSDTIEAKSESLICEFSDGELEGYLDELID